MTLLIKVRRHIIFVLFLLISSLELFSQTKIVDINKQVINLMLRVDSLEGAVFYDSALNSKHLAYWNDIKLDNFKRELEFIKKNTLTEIILDRNSIVKYIPFSKYLVSDTQNSKEVVLKNCVYTNEIFSNQMDSLSERISKNYNNKKIYDSLILLQYFGIKSTVARMVETRCNKITIKKFILFKVFESTHYYLILYGLKVKAEENLSLKSEIIFK